MYFACMMIMTHTSMLQNTWPIQFLNTIAGSLYKSPSTGI